MWFDLAPHAMPRSVPPGTVLWRRGEPAEQVLYLRQGRVALGQWSLGEMAQCVGAVQGPCWLEAASALLALPHAVDAVAETAVEVQALPAAQVQAHVQGLAEPARALLLDVARAQRQQTEWALSRLVKDADARCAQWLLQHAQAVAEGLQVQLQERKRAVAAQLGMAPETFSRTLKQLRELGLIAGRGRVLQLTNPDALRDLAGA